MCFDDTLDGAVAVKDDSAKITGWLFMDGSDSNGGMVLLPSGYQLSERCWRDKGCVATDNQAGTACFFKSR